MPVKNISHDSNGEIIERVPVEHKLSIGLPRGYKKTPTSVALNAPQKLFHFLVQTRDKNGNWAYDKNLAIKLFGHKEEDREKPQEVEIQLVGNSIEDMVYSDLFYWSTTQGAKCSAKTMKPYLQQWCEDRNIPWEEPLSNINTSLEMEALLNANKIDKRLKKFISETKVFIDGWKSVMNEHYNVEVDDIINATLAMRMPNTGGPMKLYPCTFRQCPDYIRKGKCKYNGRFFFVFKGQDIGEITTFVTSSPKNIQNIQWGLSNVIEKVIKGRQSDDGHDLTMHGITCRITGRKEKGMYMGNEGQASTQFYLVKIKGPYENMIKSAESILNEARDMSKLFPKGIKVKFDEGDEVDLAKERINEFSEEHPTDELPEKGDKEEFKVENHDVKKSKKKKETTVEFFNKTEELLGKTKKMKDDEELCHMVKTFANYVDKLEKTNGLKQLTAAFIVGIKNETLTVKQILKSQERMKNFGSKVNFEKELKIYKKQSKKENK